MVPGIKFDFGGGKVYTVPPLALGDLRRLQKQIVALNANALDAATVDTVVDAVHSALKRNYTGITVEEVEGLVDLGNMFDALGCVMDAGGVKRKQIEEDQKNALGATQATGLSPSTGTPSTPESAPTPAGPGTTSTST